MLGSSVSVVSFCFEHCLSETYLVGSVFELELIGISGRCDADISLINDFLDQLSAEAGRAAGDEKDPVRHCDNLPACRLWCSVATVEYRRTTRCRISKGPLPTYTDTSVPFIFKSADVSVKT